MFQLITSSVLCFTSFVIYAPGGPNASRKPPAQDRADFMKWDYVSSWLKMKKQFYEIQPDRREVHAPWAHRRYEEHIGCS
jgi:hypothetical protein